MAPKRKVAPKGKASPTATFAVQSYTRWVNTYTSRDECFADLGCGQHCKSHSARAVKRAGPFTHLRCRLRSSAPSCTWAAVMREAPDGSVELLQLPGTQHADHDQESTDMGKYGWDSLEERKSVKVE